MANFTVENVAIKGISACVPSKKEDNYEFDLVSPEERKKFIESTGVRYRRIADDDTCTSDLCYKAAERLIEDLAWERESINLLVFVTQTPDYIVPVTSALLQNRLGLSTDCISFDVPLGCSGYVYGLSIISSLMNSSGIKRALLLAGDTSSKVVSDSDKSTAPLFGDAGTATAIEFKQGVSKMFFNLGTDGSGYESIIIPDGGYRSPTTPKSFEYKSYGQGIKRNNCHLVLDGLNVFSFGITRAPKTVKEICAHFDIDIDGVDYFVFHQANLKMNEMIRKKLRIEASKVPYSLKEYGNTSSATIPLTIVSELKETIENREVNVIMCGFGVGLSWGYLYCKLENIKCPNIIEV